MPARASSPYSHSSERLLSRGLKLSHIRLIAALARTGGMQAAADHLLISQPAASRLAAEIQAIVGQRVHQRSGKGIELTLAGQALARRALRALQEIEDAQKDILEIGQGLVGNVRIGSVTGPAVEYILPALREARITMPNVTISVEVATSDILVDHLALGDLDFVLGRLPADQAGLFEQTPIALEPLSIIARNEHPLTRINTAGAEQLLQFDWVLPFKGTLLRTSIEHSLRTRGLDLPTHTFNTSSFLLTLALVRQSNAIAPIATSVAKAFGPQTGQGASLEIIRSDMDLSVEMFSLLKPAKRMFTSSINAVYELVLKIADQQQGGTD